MVRYRRPLRGQLLGVHDLTKQVAVMSGKSLHVAGRLLGHRRASTTKLYVQDDAALSQAVERVASVIEQKLRRTEPFG